MVYVIKNSLSALIELTKSITFDKVILMTYSNTLTSKGQVTIPVSIRRALGLQAGESVTFKLSTNNKVFIEKNDWQQVFDDIHTEVASHLKSRNIKPLSDEELDDLINSEAIRGATENYAQKSRY